MKRFALTAAALCVAVSVFAQGLYWESKTEGTVGERTTQNYAMPKMFKMVHTGESQEGSVIIARLDKDLFWTLNPGEKTYSELTFADMEKLMNKAGGKMDEAMAKMREQMKGMSQEQREMVEKMMADKMPMSPNAAPVEVKKTKERKTISGYACTEYVADQGGKEIMTMWVTKDVKGFEPLMADWKTFAERMSALTSRFAKGMSDAYKTIDGFPMQTTVSMMNNTITTTVTKVEKRSTPASEFDIPSGYTKVKSDMEDAMEKMNDDE